MNNGPISVSGPGVSLIGASASDITFSTRYPFAKLDSTNPNSFEVITLFFNNEPPDPAPGLGSTASLKTLVYSYPHGYTYEPSTWFLVSVDNFTSVKGSEGSWVVGNNSGSSPAIAKFEIEVDATNVNFYIDKTWTNDGINGPPHVIGLSISIRAYIFVEGLAGDSVPTHA